jgi:hypothetical protein
MFNALFGAAANFRTTDPAIMGTVADVQETALRLISAIRLSTGPTSFPCPGRTPTGENRSLLSFFDISGCNFSRDSDHLPPIPHPLRQFSAAHPLLSFHPVPAIILDLSHSLNRITHMPVPGNNRPTFPMEITSPSCEITDSQLHSPPRFLSSPPPELTPVTETAARPGNVKTGHGLTSRLSRCLHDQSNPYFILALILIDLMSVIDAF